MERGQGEVMEVQLSPDFEPTPLCEIKMDVPCVIAIVRRGSKVIIPKGQTVIKPCDILMIFTMADNVAKVKESLK